MAAVADPVYPLPLFIERDAIRQKRERRRQQQQLSTPWPPDVIKTSLLSSLHTQRAWLPSLSYFFFFLYVFRYEKGSPQRKRIPEWDRVSYKTGRVPRVSGGNQTHTNERMGGGGGREKNSHFFFCVCVCVFQSRWRRRCGRQGGWKKGRLSFHFRRTKNKKKEREKPLLRRCRSFGLAHEKKNRERRRYELNLPSVLSLFLFFSSFFLVSCVCVPVE